MRNFIKQVDTAHAYLGGGVGANSIDGDFVTGQIAGVSGGGGSSGGQDLTSEHIFAAPVRLKRLDWYAYAFSSSDGDTDNGANAYSYIEVLDATTLLWTTVTGTLLNQSHNNGGGGGATGNATSANPASLTVDISNVLGVRLKAGAHGFTNGGGSWSATTGIYEIQAWGDPPNNMALLV